MRSKALMQNSSLWFCAVPPNEAYPEPRPGLQGKEGGSIIVTIATFIFVMTRAGGLGDVMGALPKALARRGHKVMVVAPRYGEYAEGWETGVRRQMRVFGGDQQVNNLNTTKPQTSIWLSPPAAHALMVSCVT